MGINVTEFEKGFICGILIGEGSFTGDMDHPAIAVKMHVRSIETLQRLHDLFDGSKIHGPYLHNNRNYFLWSLRGKALINALPFIDEISVIFDSHVMGRYMRMKEKYNL